MTAQLNRILMVEDEPDIQTIAKLVLESDGGFTVETCNSGSEAIEKAPAFEPDLILLDVMMPGMDGPTTLKVLRRIKQLSLTPVIFMTAKVQFHEIEGYKNLGAMDVITKPFDPMQLSNIVMEIWSKNNV